LLGDINIAVDVMVFDDGRHSHPGIHATPFPACLLFTPGALLRNDRGGVPACWCAVKIEQRIALNFDQGLNSHPRAVGCG
jgi:hypothetical protein